MKFKFQRPSPRAISRYTCNKVISVNVIGQRLRGDQLFATFTDTPKFVLVVVHCLCNLPDTTITIFFEKNLF